MLRSSEDKRIHLDSKLAEEQQRHKEFKRKLQAKVEILKDEVLEKTASYKRDQEVL